MSDPTQKKIQAQLQKLLALPDNKLCADCPLKNPRWASVKLGIFLCIPCAGVHRSLGTHISYVKSCSLDNWKPEWVPVMRDMGNKKAKSIYEARAPRNYVPPTENSRELSDWIKRKYVTKEFMGEPLAEPVTIKSKKSKPKFARNTKRTTRTKKRVVKPKQTVKPPAPAPTPAPVQPQPNLLDFEFNHGPTQPVSNPAGVFAPPQGQPNINIPTFNPHTPSPVQNPPAAVHQTPNGQQPNGVVFSPFVTPTTHQNNPSNPQFGSYQVSGQVSTIEKSFFDQVVGSEQQRVVQQQPQRRVSEPRATKAEIMSLFQPPPPTPMYYNGVPAVHYGYQGHQVQGAPNGMVMNMNGYRT